MKIGFIIFGKMKLRQALWMVWGLTAAVLASPTGDTAANDAAQTSDLPENWDQAKDDTQSLFLNKNNKNDLEPYPMALSEEVTNTRYGVSPVQSDFVSKSKGSSSLDSIMMRPELYGEPPAMTQYDRLYNDIDRRKRGVIPTIPKKSGIVRKRRSKPTKVAARPKRESGMSSADVLTLLSLWEAQQRRNQEHQYPTYFTPENYYNVDSSNDEQGLNFDELADEHWLDEPVVPSSRETGHYQRGYEDLDPYASYYPKVSHFRPELYQSDQTYLRNDDADRRKKQWVGFRNANRVSKRFMVAKKRGDPMQAYQKNYRPREDLYSLVELLKSTPDNYDQELPVYRRRVL